VGGLFSRRYLLSTDTKLVYSFTMLLMHSLAIHASPMAESQLPMLIPPLFTPTLRWGGYMIEYNLRHKHV
jgi:hypothetical protein